MIQLTFRQVLVYPDKTRQELEKVYRMEVASQTGYP